MAKVSYSRVPIPGFDENQFNHEHDELVELINDCLTSFEKSSSLEPFFLKIERLRKKTGEHFAHEEAVMKKASYPAIQRHTEEHRNLLADLDSMVEQLSLHKDKLTGDIAPYLRRYYNHMTTQDMAFGHFLHSRSFGHA